MNIAILKTQGASHSPNISLKDNSKELSQISSNDETSLNNNIKSNSQVLLQVGGNLTKW
jgi:hypothetical protein